MVNITNKLNSLRIAIATATVKVSKPETIQAIEQRKVPKGDVFEFARAAGLLGVKKTSDVIPDCHPLPVEFTSITYEIIDLTIVISVEVHTIYKTGVEVEAMHGAAVTALTMYDMLKPIDKFVEIHAVKLLKKSGGKTDFNKQDFSELKAAVVVCSDTISSGNGEDRSGKTIIAKLEVFGIETLNYEVIADDFDTIQSLVKSLSTQFDLVIFTGGTGLSPRDFTVDAIQPLIEKSIDGIMEQARRYGQDRMPYAMLSRGVSGLIGNCLVLTLPGSVKGVTESMDAIFPHVLHIFKVIKGDKH
ncbi:bifunctional molybdenum cofactor biosynthesis protein MoaC/MoaB [Pedobacter mucosus]|uniref:bifunctional molybdenum cofactor biosynthesis protein MoaC/MoaB n=1 Tax=Pedobacter mucosus TaxID=2895286 RepID=UPI001EE47CD0|nr:bifunctional molybdenum cofactor biosynthesis protein MoaC/MoaB [Pedobacter mucosus]UKT62265.1 bifunctional molybdenum cofactor biosynthesis protein MoaC/MoaB [Pedobacter mucosus]